MNEVKKRSIICGSFLVFATAFSLVASFLTFNPSENNNTEIATSDVETSTIELKVGDNFNFNGLSDLSKVKLTDNSIIKIDENGKIIALKEGETEITYITENNEEKKYTIVVSAKDISISFVNPSVEIKPSTTTLLQLNYIPSTPVEFISANPSIASVDSYGFVTGHSIGNTSIFAKTINSYCACEVSVAIPVEDISFSRNKYEIFLSQSTYVDAKVLPINATNKEIEYVSSNEEIVSVDSNGKIVGVGIGQSQIKAISKYNNEVFASVDVLVKEPITKIYLDKKEEVIFYNQQKTLHAFVKSSLLLADNITWSSSNPSIASVDSNGVVKANNIKGETVITATISSYSSSCLVKVAAEPKQIKLLISPSGKKEFKEVDPASVYSINKGERYDVDIVLTPSDAYDEDIKLVSSSSSVISISDKEIQANSVGDDVEVFASTINGVSTSIKFKVIVPTTNIELNVSDRRLGGSKKRLNIDSFFQLIPIITPFDSTDNVLWTSSNPQVASVSASGLVKGLSKGETTITVQSGDYFDTCTFEVAALPTRIVLDKENVTFNKNRHSDDSVNLKATIYPSNAWQDITWYSSNLSVARVDENGNVTIINPGEATIYAKTVNNIIASSRIVAISYAQTLRLDTNSLFFDVYLCYNIETVHEKVISAFVNPLDAYKEELIWESNNPDLVAVEGAKYTDDNGQADAIVKIVDDKKIGEANISVRVANSNLVASCQVHVVEGPTSISIDPSQLDINCGEEADLKVDFEPSALPEESRQLYWESSDTSILQVDQNGHITTSDTNSGEVEVIVTSISGIKAKCLVNVIYIEATSVSFDKSEVKISGYSGTRDKLNLSNTCELTVEVKPIVNNDTLSFSCSDNSVVKIISADTKVDSNGKAKIKVQAVENVYGTAIITAKCGKVEGTVKVHNMVMADSLSISITNPYGNSISSGIGTDLNMSRPIGVNLPYTYSVKFYKNRVDITSLECCDHGFEITTNFDYTRKIDSTNGEYYSKITAKSGGNNATFYSQIKAKVTAQLKKNNNVKVSALFNLHIGEGDKF